MSLQAGQSRSGLVQTHSRRLPRVAYPHVADRLGGQVAVLGQHGVGKLTLLGLVLVVQDEDGEGGGLAVGAKLLTGRLDVLLELFDGILERGASVVNFIDDQDPLAHQRGHLQAAQVQPLRARDLGPGRFDGVAAAQVLVQAQTDGLDGDVGRARSLEE